jgi:hypothetical protein
MATHLLLIVAESYRLTGLGVLAIGAPSEPALQHFALHTKLEVRLQFPDGGGQQMVVASVEEMTRAAESAGSAATTAPVLLLESELIADLPPGTEIWWLGSADELR